MRHARQLLPVLAALSLAGPAAAQGAHATKLTLDLGYVNVSGNTRLTTFNLGEKLSGREKYWMRQGAYRVLYAIDAAVQTVTVVAIGHRRDVYR